MVRGGGEKTRRTALAVFSILAAVSMLGTNASAAANTMYVEDELGDFGHCGVAEEGGVWTLWPENSVLGDAYYLDIVAGWLTMKNDKATAGIEVAAPISDAGVLPSGVKEIWWVWYFWLSDDPALVHSNYAVYVTWDGVGFESYLVDQNDRENPPYPVVALKKFTVAGPTVEVTFNLDLISGATMWLFETQVWMTAPPAFCEEIPLYGWFWYAADLTDGDTWLSWLPMP